MLATVTHVDYAVKRDWCTGGQDTLTLTKANRLDDARALGGNCQEDDVLFSVITKQDMG